jgi:polyisoprenoid-binding protein YceI
MTGKLLQWVGAIGLLAALGAVAAGFAVLKDRVRIVVAADEVAAGPDPVQLLRDDVQTLRGELEQLRSALGENFERLAQALDAPAAQRHGDVIEARRELAAVVARQAAAEHVLQQIAARLPQLEQHLVALRERGAAAEVAAVPSADPAPSAPTPPSALEPALTPPPAEVPSAVPPKPAGSFLSFRVAEAKFEFDAPNEWVLVPDLCRVGFDAKSTLHDFTGVTSKVAGQFRADLDAVDAAMLGEITCDPATLATGVDGRDSNLREHLDTGRFPAIRFEVTGFAAAAGGVDRQAQTARGTVRGRMTIRGQTRELVMPVELAVDGSKRLVVKGQVPLKLSDYGVPVPSQLGLINMQDEVQVWVALRARLQTGGRK